MANEESITITETDAEGNETTIEITTSRVEGSELGDDGGSLVEEVVEALFDVEIGESDDAVDPDDDGTYSGEALDESGGEIGPDADLTSEGYVGYTELDAKAEFDQAEQLSYGETAEETQDAYDADDQAYELAESEAYEADADYEAGADFDPGMDFSE